VRVFIGVSDHTCINICVCIMFKKNWRNYCRMVTQFSIQLQFLLITNESKTQGFSVVLEKKWTGDATAATSNKASFSIQAVDELG
jgi:hypothetical protein